MLTGKEESWKKEEEELSGLNYRRKFHGNHSGQFKHQTLFEKQTLRVLRGLPLMT